MLRLIMIDRSRLSDAPTNQHPPSSKASRPAEAVISVNLTDVGSSPNLNNIDAIVEASYGRVGSDRCLARLVPPPFIMGGFRRLIHEHSGGSTCKRAPYMYTVLLFPCRHAGPRAADWPLRPIGCFGSKCKCKCNRECMRDGGGLPALKFWDQCRCGPTLSRLQGGAMWWGSVQRQRSMALHRSGLA